MEYIKHYVSEHFINALIYGDNSGLSDKEEKQLDKFIKDNNLVIGQYSVHDYRSFRKCEISNLDNECIILRSFVIPLENAHIKEKSGLFYGITNEAKYFYNNDLVHHETSIDYKQASYVFDLWSSSDIDISEIIKLSKQLDNINKLIENKLGISAFICHFDEYRTYNALYEALESYIQKLDISDKQETSLLNKLKNLDLFSAYEKLAYAFFILNNSEVDKSLLDNAINNAIYNRQINDESELFEYTVELNDDQSVNFLSTDTNNIIFTVIV